MVFAGLVPSARGLRNKPMVTRTPGGPWRLWDLKTPPKGGVKKRGSFPWATGVLNLLSALGSFRGALETNYHFNTFMLMTRPLVQPSTLLSHR